MTLASDLSYHLPKVRLTDTLGGAAVGAAGGGLLYAARQALARKKDPKLSLLSHVAGGAATGAVAGNVVGDRARRYVSNMLVPAGYDDKDLVNSSNAGKTHLQQLVPNSLSELYSSLIADKPSKAVTGDLKMQRTADAFKLTPADMTARYEFMRHAMGLPIADPENALLRPTGQATYKPTETSGGVPGTFRSVGLNPKRWADEVTPDLKPVSDKMQSRIRSIVRHPERQGAYPAMGDWLSRHGYADKPGNKLNVNDLWDFELTPTENKLLIKQILSPSTWNQPAEDYKRLSAGGWRAPVDGFTEHPEQATNKDHMLSMLKRKLLNTFLLDGGGVVFNQDFDKKTGQPVFR